MNEDRERLDKLNIALNLPGSSPPHLDIVRYRTLLDNDFLQNTLGHSEPTRLTYDKLEDEEMFQHWALTNDPCLLHLSGQNWSGNNSNSTLLWLSPAAILVTEKYLSSGIILVYYLCQVNYHVRKQERSYIHSLTSNIVFQLVSHRPELLRSGELSRSITASLDEALDQTGEEDVALDNMRDCVLHILDNFKDDDQVVLILDRPDKCYCGGEELTAIDTLKCLLQIALVARCHVRILIVARSSWLSAKQTKKLEDWLQKEKRLGSARGQGLRYLHRHDWNQESQRERSLSPALA